LVPPTLALMSTCPLGKTPIFPQKDYNISSHLNVMTLLI
jgi:hypothetical protein